MKTAYYYICILLLCASCQPDRLNTALELAGENRAELEKVLAHCPFPHREYAALVQLLQCDV